MTDNLRFLMLVGIPGCGKSTFAKELMEGRDDIVYLSSDLIREELTGDINNQDVNTEVFEQMRKRTLEALKNEKHVIYDATNINRKKRKGLLTQIPKDVEKVALYIATDFNKTKEQNVNRERVVPQHVLNNMYKNFQIPIYSEGWDKIIIDYDYESHDFFPKQFTDAIRVGAIINREGYELMEFLSTYFDEFNNILELSQDSKYHNFSVSRHTYYVYRHVLENYKAKDDNDMEVMLWTALLHDTGKHFCKSFINRKGEETRYANFISHENVSSQLAVNVLKKLGFDDLTIHKIATLIHFHMYLLNENNNRNKLKAQVGEEMFAKLEFLREADTLAH